MIKANSAIRTAVIALLVAAWMFSGWPPIWNSPRIPPPVDKAEAAWWNTSWHFKIPITVNNSGNANTLTDYQMLIKLDSSDTDFWSNVRNTGDDVRFTNASETALLDFYRLYWNYASTTAYFWVKIDSISGSTAATSTYLYYGNSSAIDASSASSTFTYAATTTRFYALGPAESTNAGGAHADTFFDGNNFVANSTVQNPWNTGSSTNPLTVPGPVGEGTPAKATGPIAIEGNNYTNGEMWSPDAWQSELFVDSSYRVGYQPSFLNPSAATATVTVYKAGAQVDNFTLAPGQSVDKSYNNATNVVMRVVSTQPILMFHRASANEDTFQVPPPATQLIGIERNLHITPSDTSSTNITVYYSDGSAPSTYTGVSTIQAPAGGGTYGTGPAAMIFASNPVNAYGAADGNGTEAESFYPLEDLGDDYLIPYGYKYLSCAAPYPNTTITVYDANGNQLATSGDLGSSNASTTPYFWEDSTVQSTAERVSANNPFYCYYENNATSQETNLASLPMNRKGTWPHPAYSLGVQESQATAFLNQTHYHWRNDDGSESGATSATNGVEDSSLLNVATATERLRIEVSNNGGASASSSFRLEYGPKSGTCASISSWEEVGSSGADWVMATSSFLTDGADTTNIAISTGGVADSNTTFLTPNGGVKTTSAQAGLLTLSSSNFAELEYSIRALDSAAAGQTYCFRVTNAGAPIEGYSIYPQATITAPATTIGEFGTVVLTGSSTQIISLAHSYSNLIVVASPRYAPTADVQRFPRVVATTTNSFTIRVYNAENSLASTATTTVDWLAMNAGSYILPDGGAGTRVVAGSVITNGTFCKTNTVSGSPVTINFPVSFNGPPSVVSMVDSNNDPAWTATHVDDGSSVANDPTVSTMRLMLMVSAVPCSGSPHGAETIDYIAFDTAHGTNNGTEFDAAISAGTTKCCTAAGYPESYTASFTAAPAVTLISQMGENGGEGGYALTDTGTAGTATTHYGSIDEDGPTANRNHVAEDVGIIAFGPASGTIAIFVSYDQTAFRTFQNLDSTSVGTPFDASTNTTSTMPQAGNPFRLRMLMLVLGSDLPLGGQNFKLQVATSTAGGCNTGFAGKTYVDVATSTGVVRFYNNPTPNDGVVLTPTASDPVYGSFTIVNESYKEQNVFSDSISQISKNQQGKWDFALENFSAAPGDVFCFRMVESDGTLLDTYNIIPEVEVDTGPTIRNFTLNGGQDIALIEGTTTLIEATATIDDADGYWDIYSISGRMYRTSLGSSCTANSNNCYIAAPANCTLSSCGGTSCVATCKFQTWYFAEPTDAGTPWAGDSWTAFMQASDTAGIGANGTSSAVALLSLLALSPTPTINYGNLLPGGSVDPLSIKSSVSSTGNVSMDMALYGTNMINGANSIPVGDQRFATSSATYASGSVLLANPGTTLDINLPKTTASSSPATTTVYWGISLPSAGLPSGNYTGANAFVGVLNSLPWP